MVMKTNHAGYFRILGNVRDYPTRPAFRIEEVSPLYAWISSQWERSFKPFWFIQLVHDKYLASTIVVIFYLMICKYGVSFMKKREELNLRKVIITWNLSLFLFNFIVVIKLIPVLLYTILNYTFNGLLIIPPIYTYAFGTPGLWVCLFIISKYIELIDTFFLILRKKKITLLHWFHHATVLLYTWDTYSAEVSAGFIFIIINAFVHTIMYFYYFLATLYNKPLTWSIFVTVLQIFQMILGITITLYCLYITYAYKFSNYWDLRSIRKLQHKFTFDRGHYINRTNLVCASLMYLSYIFLFVKYFCDRYVRAAPNQEQKQGQKQEQKQGQKQGQKQEQKQE
ncbi:elongation of very long chain fatty acids protein 3 [Plasmodium gonderi]|uniref:Elongation of fatty acids protein n=1 Tax=Plasmodium gonderi TaxID=77519 RepID=A0A1Y1J9A8_PLAGO|nr:elongation of very long chain fatty acids protein 3 [Plasmodium gonderi]GAW79086.1 elongation of very long chain fatty acids protein 3 [Plasmodium gonderi]